MKKISVLVLFAWSLLIVLQAQELVFQDKDGIVRWKKIIRKWHCSVPITVCPHHATTVRQAM